jgi:prephenate dehydratase
MAVPGATLDTITTAHSHVHALGQCRKVIREHGLRPIISGDTAGAAREVAESGDGLIITTFLFRVRNVPAALYKAMGGFATNGVNMTKLESYMVGGHFTATQFLAEVDGHPDDPGVRNALEELAFVTTEVKVLGVYPADAFRAD